MALSTNAVGCHGVDSSVDGGGGRFDLGAVRRARLEGEAAEKEKRKRSLSGARRDRGNRCGHSGKLCALLLMRCFRNPRDSRRIGRPVYVARRSRLRGVKRLQNERVRHSIKFFTS